MYGDNEFPVSYFTFNHSREMPFGLACHVRSATNYLEPFVHFIRLIEANTMLVSSNQELATSLFEQQSPKLGTSALPHREVGLVLFVLVVRIDIAWVRFRIGVEERDVTKGNKIRSTRYLWLFECVSKPGLLSNTVGFAHERLQNFGFVSNLSSPVSSPTSAMSPILTAKLRPKSQSRGLRSSG